MKTLLFLDIDDVLAHWQQFHGKQHLTPLGEIYKMDKESVKVLNEILDEVDCDIIIHSDWRWSYDLDEMQWYFNWNNVNQVPVDFTPKFGYERKTDEIMSYVNKHKPDKWVAIDDLHLGVDNFVHCKKTNEGIKQTGIKKKIINFLL